MNYQDFGIVDFLNDGFFREWVQSPSPEKDIFWENFISTYPEKAETIDTARKLIFALTEIGESELQQLQVTQITEQTWQRLASEIHSEDNQQVQLQRPVFRLGWVAAAAGLCLAVGIWFWLLKASPADNSYENQVAVYKTSLIEQVNNTAEKQRIVLPDGSSVMLEKNSKISFSSTFTGNKREVFLTGEAFFEVTHNTQKPFIVYTNEVTTKVLGTSFRIKAYRNESTILVAVKTGKVSVAVKEKETTVLRPNQQVIYNKSQENLRKELVEKPYILIPKPATSFFSFDNTPLREVFEKMKMSYGIDIIFDEMQLSGCNLTADLEEESLYDKLNLICKTLNLDYKIIDGQIVISGQGCHH